MSRYAIVGISCLFPGATTPEEYWRNLVAGVDSRREGGEPVFGPGLSDVDSDPAHRIVCTRGGFVQDFTFDPSGYLLRPEELEGLDRVHRWSLHVAREALRDSGYHDHPEVLARTGLVLGNYSFPTPTSAQLSVPLIHQAVLDGLRRGGIPTDPTLARVNADATRAENAWVSGMPARSVAVGLGLGGPRYALDAACSSALYALKLACDHLATGQADVVMAGAVCAPDPTLIHLSFSDLRAYPENGGLSQPFDRRSAGILTGQGAGMLVLRRLADAQRAGDRIYAVVDGIGVSNDGTGRHLLLPNRAGQCRTYDLAYAQADVDPAQIDYLECHATGTPAGDTAEAESVAEFFGGHGAVPLLGSVKGNIGHLLTVAGLSSVLKVVLAMGNGTIPPTTGITEPISSSDGAVDDAVVRRAREWPEHPGPRRAAVSAFGFGGTNAHLVLSSSPTEGSVVGEAPRVMVPALDVVGMGAHFGPLDSVDAVERALYDGTDIFGPLPERRWRGMELTASGILADACLTRDRLPYGAFVDDVEIDPVEVRFPPADLRTVNLQHLLALQVCDEALRDAGLSRCAGNAASRRIAVVIAMETEPSTNLHLARYGIAALLREVYAGSGLELSRQQQSALEDLARDSVHEPVAANEVLSYIGSVMSSRISSLWNLTGPSFTISSDQAAAVEALQAAQLLLLDPTIEAVLVGAVDLAGSPEHLLLRMVDGMPTGSRGLSFGDGTGGWRIGEGAGAVVVTRAGETIGAGARAPYARLDSAVLRHPGPTAGTGPDPELVAQVAVEALAAAGARPDEIGCVEAHAAGTPERDAAEIAGLSQVYAGHAVPTAGTANDGGSSTATTLPTRSTALTSTKAYVGDAGIAGPMAGLIHAVLCLHHAQLPAAPGWSRPAAQFAEALENSGLYIADRPRPWLRTRNLDRRRAAVNVLCAGGTAAHLVFSADRTIGDSTVVAWHRSGSPVVLALGAGDVSGLVDSAKRAADRLRRGDPTHQVAREAAAELPASRVRAVLVGSSPDDLIRELQQAASDLPGVHERGGEWATPVGSYATARPVGPDGRVALVFPGAFTSYPGLGQDLFRAFPGLLAQFESEAPAPDRMLRAAELYPRGLVAPTRRDLMAVEEGFADDVPFMLAAGTSFANLYTDLVRKVLRIPVQGAFGYCLGESSMLFATGRWPRKARREAQITETPVFRDRLCGVRRAVREAWNLPDDVPDRQLWGTHIVLADSEAVGKALARYDRLFVTHINTPTEVVVAGDPAQFRELVAELGCATARSPANVVLHCPLVDADLTGLADLNRYPVSVEGELELLSAYDYSAVPDLGSDTVADRIASTLRATIDFPRLVDAAYERGFRYFIEAGPGSTCTRWIREILGDRAHVAVSVDRRGTLTGKAVASMAARLVAHGVPVDLDALLDAHPTSSAAGRSLVRAGGGDPIPDRLAGGVAELLGGSMESVTVPDAGTSEPTVATETTETVGSVPIPAAEAESAVAFRTGPSTNEDVDMTERITFDGEPATVLPWAAPVEPSPSGPRPVPAAVGVDASARAGTAGTPAVAALVRELRQQIVAAHVAVLSTQRVLQQGVVERIETSIATPTTLRCLEVPTPPDGSPGQQDLPHDPFPVPAAASGTAEMLRSRRAGVIWDSDDLMEFATGSIEKVFGAEFAVIDGYSRRVRLPAPPYHFVSRVTELRAETGRFEPSFIRTEYDVPADAWYCVDGGVPPAVTIEAGQCDLLLISYLGIDFRNRGQRVYRLLNSTLLFHGDLPHAGQTLRYDISINRFVYQGESTLFFFSYLCYADGELILELKDACAGFFSRSELASPLGIVTTDQERAERAALPRGTFKPLADTDRVSLTEPDLDLLSQGRVADVFGPYHGQDPGLNPALRLPAPKLWMIDEVTRIDRTGGPRGLGAITAMKRLRPDGWYFACHFPDDPVLAGSMVAEGAVQLLQIYLLYQGMHLVLPDARFQNVIDREIDVRVRGQITPEHSEIRYEVEVMELTLLPRPTVIADVLVYLGDKPVIHMRDLGIQIREKPGTPYRPEIGGVPKFLGRRNRNGEPALINELHLAHDAKGDLAIGMGPEFEIYRTSRAPYLPNGDFRFVDRVMSLHGTRGDLRPGAEMITEYDSPADAWYYRQASHPGMPNCVYMETSLQAAILLGYYLGATLPRPDIEYSIRNLEGHATLLRSLDLAGKTIRHHSTLLSHSTSSGTVLQNFSYQLSVDGEVFYTGESLFGYFSEAALANQVGLDNGNYLVPWLEREQVDLSRVRHIDLTSQISGPANPAGDWLRLPGGQFDLVDSVDLVAGGGRHGRGYLHGRRRIRSDEWYFDCHFHRDPVMPGSLGVEAALQAMRVFAIEQGLAADIPRPYFAPGVDVELCWRYRGQILREDRELRFDVHIKEIVRHPDRICVIADAEIWKPALRIYELTDLSLDIRPGR